MPRITAPSLVEHREQRRAHLLEAAATLIRRGGSFTVAEVASEVGLSRSAVYEYYSSAADLIADVLVDEMADWAALLQSATETVEDPYDRVDAWVRAVLDYVAEGRHALVRAAGTIDLPATRRDQVQALHRELVAPLHQALADMGDVDPGQLAMYVWGIVDASITRIEVGQHDPEDELRTVLLFVSGGLRRAIAARN